MYYVLRTYVLDINIRVCISTFEQTDNYVVQSQRPFSVFLVKLKARPPIVNIVGKWVVRCAACAVLVVILTKISDPQGQCIKDFCPSFINLFDIFAGEDPCCLFYYRVYVRSPRYSMYVLSRFVVPDGYERWTITFD